MAWPEAAMVGAPCRSSDRRSNRPCGPRLTAVAGAKARRVSPLELPKVCVRDGIERKPQRVGRYREAPEDIAELLDESLRVDRSLLKRALPNESEHLAGLLGEP